MSTIGRWFFDLQEKHYEGECDKCCQFCQIEPHTRGIRK